MTAWTSDSDQSPDAPHRIHHDTVETVALECDHCDWPEFAAGGQGAPEVALALLANRESNGSRRQGGGLQQALGDMQCRGNRHSVVTDSWADQPASFPTHIERYIARENGVDVSRDQKARPAFAPFPDQIPRVVPPASPGRVGQATLEPLNPLALLEGRRRRLGYRDRVGHERFDRDHAGSTTRRAASTMASALGNREACNTGAAGRGTSPAPTRAIGASRCQNSSPAMRAASSAPNPPVTFASWAITTRPVLSTDLATASKSKGASQRRSMTSTSTPSS